MGGVAGNGDADAVAVCVVGVAGMFAVGDGVAAVVAGGGVDTGIGKVVRALGRANCLLFWEMRLCACLSIPAAL